MSFPVSSSDFVDAFANQQLCLHDRFERFGGSTWKTNRAFLEATTANVLDGMAELAGHRDRASAWKYGVHEGLRTPHGARWPSASHAGAWVRAGGPPVPGIRPIPNPSNAAVSIAGYLNALAVESSAALVYPAPHPDLLSARKAVIAYHALSACSRATLAAFAGVKTGFELAGDPFWVMQRERVANLGVERATVEWREPDDVFACGYASLLQDEVRLLGPSGIACGSQKPFLARDIQKMDLSRGPSGMRARVLNAYGHGEDHVTTKNSESFIARLVEYFCSTDRDRRRFRADVDRVYSYLEAR
jgi:hypothetical protein